MSSNKPQPSLDLPEPLEVLRNSIELVNSNVTDLHPLLDLLAKTGAESEGIVKSLMESLMLLSAEVQESRTQRENDRLALAELRKDLQETHRKVDFIKRLMTVEVV